MDKKELIKDQTTKLFELLYAKGKLDYEIDFGTNNKFFRLREDTRAYLFHIYVTIDPDKVLPNSKDYDPNYVKILDKLVDAEESIPRYLGEPNLVFTVEYMWDREKMKKVFEQFKKITYEVATNVFEANKERLKKSNISSTKYFLNAFDFGIYPDLSDLDAEMGIDVLSHGLLCGMISEASFIETYVEPVLEKYGYGGFNIENNLCEGEG